MKLYTKGDGEVVYPLSHFKKMAKEEDREIIVYECKQNKESKYMFCNLLGDVGERGNCAEFCIGYRPRNGKSGNCKHNKPVYNMIGDAIIVKP